MRLVIYAGCTIDRNKSIIKGPPTYRHVWDESGRIRPFLTSTGLTIEVYKRRNYTFLKLRTEMELSEMELSGRKGTERDGA